MIHVAGTNGKGSTIAYLRAFLEAAGKRVHVYTSPHLVRFNERIRLAGKLVATAAAQRRAGGGRARSMPASRSPSSRSPPSAALKLFAETPADYLLLEVGLGGDFDSTNVIDHPLGAIITPVDLDHQKYLGNTIAEIASNKAGILKRGSPAVIGRQRDEGLAVHRARGARSSASRRSSQGRDYDGYAQDGPAGLPGRGRAARPAAAGAGRPPPVRQCGAGHRGGAPLQAAGERGADRRGPAHGRLAGAAAAAQGQAARPAARRPASSGSMAATTRTAPRRWPRRSRR